jgi:hypothetical protein
MNVHVLQQVSICPKGIIRCMTYRAPACCRKRWTNRNFCQRPWKTFFTLLKDSIAMIVVDVKEVACGFRWLEVIGIIFGRACPRINGGRRCRWYIRWSSSRKACGSDTRCYRSLDSSRDMNCCHSKKSEKEDLRAHDVKNVVDNANSN